MNVRAYLSPRGLANWVFAAFLALASSVGNATLLLEQQPIAAAGGSFSDSVSGSRYADDFTLPGAVNITRITWWGTDFITGDAASTEFFEVAIFQQAGALPGTVVASWTAAPIIAVGADYNQYDFDLDIGGLDLAAGGYFLSVMGITEEGLDQNDNPYSTSWAWQRNSTQGVVAVMNGTDPWATDTGDLSWRFEGTRTQIPEPSSMALLGIAGLSMLLAGRRRRQGA